VRQLAAALQNNAPSLKNVALDYPAADFFQPVDQPADQHYPIDRLPTMDHLDN
jgi:hypothetical protein